MPLITRQHPAPARDTPTTTGTVGDTPVRSTRGELDPHLAPNAVPRTGGVVLQPQTLTIAVGAQVTVRSGAGNPDLWHVVLYTGNAVTVYLGPAAGGPSFPLQNSWVLRVPGTTQDLTIVNNDTVTQTVVVVAYSGQEEFLYGPMA